MGITIGIFAKEPRPHRVKTRLARHLGADAAASLYTAMLEDTVTLATRKIAAGVTIFYDGAAPAEYLDSQLLEGVAVHPQSSGDLGERLAEASRAASKHRWLPVLFLGSDSPDLPTGLLNQAVQAAQDADVILGPTADGGVWCIGLCRPVEGFFDHLPWSSPETGKALGARAAELGLSTALLDPWWDIDEGVDLLELQKRLAAPNPSAARSAAWIRGHEAEMSACKSSIRGRE